MEHAAYQWMSKLPEGLFQKIFLKIPLADSPSDLCPLTWFEPIENQVNEQLQLINNNLEASEWSILWSKAGGNEQGKHTDFSKFDFERYAGIISVSGASKLEIGDQSTSDPTELSTISLGKGFCVIFRGDCVHAGSAYEAEDFRIYFKAIEKRKKLGDEEKNSVGTLFKCFDSKKGGCDQEFRTAEDMYKHRRKCEARHGKALLLERTIAHRKRKKKRRTDRDLK